MASTTSLVSDFKNDFRQNYPHIYFDDFISDNEIEKFIHDFIDVPYPRMMDYFADHLLSNGCEAVA